MYIIWYLYLIIIRSIYTYVYIIGYLYICIYIYIYLFIYIYLYLYLCVWANYRFFSNLKRGDLGICPLTYHYSSYGRNEVVIIYKYTNIYIYIINMSSIALLFSHSQLVSLFSGTLPLFDLSEDPGEGSFGIQ